MSRVPEAVLPEATRPNAILVVVTSNVIADVIGCIAGVVGLPIVLVDHAGGPATDELAALGLTGRHAVILTNQRRLDTAAVVRNVLAEPSDYLGMTGAAAGPRNSL